jgi:hypothetical protein
MEDYSISWRPLLWKPVGDPSPVMMMMREKSCDEEQKCRCGNQEEERTPGQTSRGEEIPGVKRDQTCQSQEAPALLVMPGHNQPDKHPDGPERETKPLAGRRPSGAGAAEDFAHREHTDKKHAEHTLQPRAIRRIP